MNSSVLQPGRNVSRVAPAGRAAVLIDGAAFFGALRQSFLNAQKSIFIVGWDIDSRTRLVGSPDEPGDGYSPLLAEFLSELVATRPQLHVYILLWDFSIVYASERELFPRRSLQWNTPDRVIFCMDNAIPFGSSQHQKLIIVDDALAFSGGLDLTQRRWDTSGHYPDNPKRIDTAAHKYPPFHDVQIMVDGEAARVLAELARRRWCNAHGTGPPISPIGT
jgi:phosphatidylserine/phosphatidylglycerophosphate/cardiolipin synthase-like enzyme